MHTLLDKDEAIGSYPFTGRWHDIGRPDDYAAVQELFAAQGSSIFGLPIC
jgi:NDP-sugar pyrophosphorylase family protein